ncbi:MAG: energy transducer TonB [Bacteroidaceae bacterium]|nr:energy transducer TonB [Bacteroidaceae bacterium]
MEIKKSKKADLEGQKSTSLLLGYICALGAMFAAFEWTTREYAETEPVKYVAYASPEEEVPPITQPIFTAAPPPPAEAPQVAEIIDIVDNNEEIEEETIQTTEDVNEAVSGPSAPVATGPVAPIGPVEVDGGEDEIFQVVEQMPQFPGGDAALMQYLSKNIKYPASAQENNIQGRAIIEFVVNKDGSIVDPKVVKSLDKACDQEAMRVIKAMPKWKPGMQRGKPVRVKYTVPVAFRLT